METQENSLRVDSICAQLLQTCKAAQLDQLKSSQSDADPCLLISSDVNCLLRINDGMFFCKEAEAVNQANERNTTRIPCKWHVTADFLGVHTEREEGETHLTQTRPVEQKPISALHPNDSQQTPIPQQLTSFQLMIMESHRQKPSVMP